MSSTEFDLETLGQARRRAHEERSEAFGRFFDRYRAFNDAMKIGERGAAEGLLKEQREAYAEIERRT